jgi:hypothetical protein
MRQPSAFTGLLKAGGMIVSLAAGLACIPTVASAQDSVPSVVRRQLEAEARRYQQHGYSLARPIIEGDLRDRQRETIRVALEGGRTYGIAGACDQDCTEIYMEVTDERGRVLDSLSEIEDPYLQFDAARTEEYVIIVSLRCVMEPCRYGLAIFASARPPSRPPASPGS